MNSSTATRLLRQTWRSSRRLDLYSTAQTPFSRSQRHLHSLSSRSNTLNSRFLAPFPKVTPRSRVSMRKCSTKLEDRPLTDWSDSSKEDEEARAAEVAERKAQQPSYQMTFTCRRCLTRSSHHVTKQGYHFGTVLITCPGCQKRHLISDHMKIFSDKGITIEDILQEKGEFLKKGRLGENGQIEFYDNEAVEAVKTTPKQVKEAGIEPYVDRFK